MKFALASNLAASLVLIARKSNYRGSLEIEILKFT
jgi:hypothetical protein